ncbi:MAG: DUF6799 domain-containing protein [Ferruginibacter sp.]
MKHLIIIITIFSAALVAKGQAISPTEPSSPDTIPAARETTMKDYFSMQARQMIFVQNNKAGRMKGDMKLKNGTIVTTTGLVKTKDGQTLQLKEGNRVYLNGLIEGLDTSPVN